MDDGVHDGGHLRRMPFAPWVVELRRGQRCVNSVTALDADPFSDPVEPQEVVEAARGLAPAADRDWQ